MISFDVFCQLNKHLAEIEFLEKGYASTKEQPVSLEMLCRSNAIRILAKKNSSLASLCANATDNESVIASLIMQCNAKTLEQMLDYFSLDDPMRNVILTRLTQLRENPSKEQSTVLPQNDSDSSFYETLKKKVELKYKSLSKFSDYAGVSKQVISKIKTEKRVSREVALHLAVALELDYEEANQLLSLAGYTMRATNRREAIISFIMRRSPYTFSDVEDALFLTGEKGFTDS